MMVGPSEEHSCESPQVPLVLSRTYLTVAVQEEVSFCPCGRWPLLALQSLLGGQVYSRKYGRHVPRSSSGNIGDLAMNLPCASVMASFSSPCQEQSPWAG